jgi:hypothetical protein
MNQPAIVVAIVVAALSLAACAAPLPDGSRILRDDRAGARTVPALTAEESRRLEQQNAQILAEQDAARAREAQADAARRAYPYYGHGPGYAPYYGPYWHAGWVWTGSRWARRPHWSFGLGIWGP